MQTVIQKFGQPIAVAGQIVDNGPVVDILSRFSEETSATIPFGVGVQLGVKRDGAKILTSSGILQGVTVAGYDNAPGSLTGNLSPTGLNPLSGIQVMNKGRVYAVIDPTLSSITPGDRGFCRYTVSGGNNILGAWSNVTDSGKNIDATKQTVFKSGIFLAADGVTKIAELEVDFTAKP